MKLHFSVLGHQLSIQCVDRYAPKTLRSVLRHLPATPLLHTPKIAGSHIYWHAPFLEDLEASADIMTAPPGTFLYWPERQFLELIFAPLQAETASVNVLGAIEGSAERLMEIGQQLMCRQGHEIIAAKLTTDEALPEFLETSSSGSPVHLQKARIQIWETCPDEVKNLLAGRGTMHPLGPLMFAESESRTLHETLWWLRQKSKDDPKTDMREAIAVACTKSASRLGGFCHLMDAAETLSMAARAWRDPAIDIFDLYRECILFIGRLADWLDLHIPWHSLNELMRDADDQRASINV